MQHRRLVALADLTSRSDLPFEERVRKLLQLGREQFGLDTGILASIEGDNYRIEHIVAPIESLITTDFTCETRDTVCREALHLPEPLGIEHLGTTQWRHHPGYLRFGIEAYLGACVRIDGRPWGMLCYTSPQPRPAPFTEEDKQYLRLMAQWIGGEMGRRQTEDALRHSQAQLQGAQSLACVGSWESIPATGEHYWSDEMYRIFGLGPSEGAPSLEKIHQMVHPDDRATRYAKLLQAREQGIGYQLEYRVIRPDGSLRYVYAQVQPFLNDRGDVIRLQGTVMDVTDRKAGEFALRESEERARRLTDAAFEGITVMLDGRMIDANAACTDMFGYTREELLAVRPLDLVAPGSRAEVLKRMTPNSEELYEAECLRKDGTSFVAELRGRPIMLGGRQGRITAIQDVTERKQADQKLREYTELLEIQKTELQAANLRLEALATQDALTGLANRRRFNDRLAGEWERAQRHHAPMTLILLDVDHFKSYNDAFGHPEGDEVLRQVGRILAEGAPRPTDLAARYGGEEFAILLPHTGIEGALVVAERIRTTIEGFDWPKRTITASLGLATRALNLGDPAELVAQADRALYQAKRDGRNRVVVAEPVRAQAA